MSLPGDQPPRFVGDNLLTHTRVGQVRRSGWGSLVSTPSKAVFVYVEFDIAEANNIQVLVIEILYGVLGSELHLGVARLGMK